MSEESNEVSTEEATTEPVGEQEESTTEESGAEPEAQEAVKSPEQKRIDKLVWEKYQARREASESKARADEILSEIERMRAGDGDGVEMPDAELVKQLVYSEAERLTSDRLFNDNCNRTYEKGKAEFKDFDASVQNLQMVGMSRDFLEIVSTASQGAKILRSLANNLDEAERINALPVTKMAWELAKLDNELSSKKVSSAPDPIRHIEGGRATATKSIYDKGLSQDEFNKLRAAQVKGRSNW